MASVRSLGRAGHNVSVGSSTRWSKAGWSRFCKSTFQYQSVAEDAEAFVRRIAEEVRLVENTLVLPMTEQTTLPISAHREVIEAAGGRLALPPHETISQAFDKQHTFRLASSLGVVVPKTLVISAESNPREIHDQLTFPVVLKPSNSQEVSIDGRVTKTGAPLYAKDRKEFVEAFEAMRQRCSRMLVQEFVTGVGVGYFALFCEGEPRAEFAHQRLRDVRPTGSGSALRISVPLNSQAREAGLAILRALRWHGVAMVEFRVRPDGTPVFMEVNGRFWNSLALAIYAGVDFPALLAGMVESGDIAAHSNYINNLRCRWLLGDFRHLIEVWRGAPKGYPGVYPNRFRTLWQFIRPVSGTFHDNFTLGDPLPELGDWLDFFVRRIPGAFKKAHASGSNLNVQGSYSRPQHLL